MFYREVNGMTFEVIKCRKFYRYISWSGIGEKNDIFHYYTKPSKIKQEIWSDWVDWANTTDGVKGLRISGANCNTFSIQGWYKEGDKLYYLWITKCHNRMYEMIQYK